MTAEPTGSPTASTFSRGSGGPLTAPISIADPRVYLAAERTLLAWIRTGVALIGLGFLVAKFGLFLRELALLRSGNLPDVSTLPDQSVLPGWIGGAIVVVGAILTLVAGFDHLRMLRYLSVDDFIGRKRRYLSGSLTLTVGSIGILLAAYLLLM